MSAIGTVIALPQSYSNYGIVRDEYGNSWVVDKGELPANLEPGEDFAYRVDFTSRQGGPTLKPD